MGGSHTLSVASFDPEATHRTSRKTVTHFEVHDMWNKAQWKRGGLAFADFNVYWAFDDRSFFGNGNLTALGNWSSWTLTYDRASVVGDPLFVDAAHDDFCLKADSPAFGLGFDALDVDVCR